MSERVEDLPGSCVLISLKEVSGLPDEDIIRVCRAHGFVGKGMSHLKYVPAAKELGIDLQKYTLPTDVFWGVPKMTLAQFCKRNPVGVFMVTTHKHAFVVRDGHVVDNDKYSGGRRVLGKAWWVRNATPTPERRRKGSWFPKDPVLVIIRWGCNRHSQSKRAKMWRAIFNKAGGLNQPFRLSAVPSYTRNDMRHDVRKGHVRVLEGEELVDALAHMEGAISNARIDRIRRGSGEPVMAFANAVAGYSITGEKVE